MKKPMEFKTRAGGTVRIMLDCLPKTAEERTQRENAMKRACCEVLANAVAAKGVHETLNRMINGSCAELLAGRI